MNGRGGTPADSEQLELLLARYADERLAADPGRVAAHRVAVLNAFVPSAGRPAPPATFRLLRGWSLAAVVAVLALGTASFVTAASDPGEPFYGLRLAIGSLTLPRDEPAHELGLASRLDDRLSEVRSAARNGDGRGVQAAIDEYLHTLSQLTTSGITDPAILSLLQRHHDALKELLTVAPRQAADGVQRALDAADDASAGAPPAHPTPGGAGASPPSTGRP